jgi:predicted lipid-binding transport protein (Tim44 family)
MKLPVVERHLLWLLALLWLAPLAWGRGGGGCLDGATPVLTPTGWKPLQELRPGDAVTCPSTGTAGRVEALYRVDPAEVFEIAVGGQTLRATATHLFELSPGYFRQAAGLRAGDQLELWDGRERRAAAIASVRRMPAAGPCWDLLVAPGGTYCAAGVVVHNKGCFLPDTLILRADGTQVAISQLKPGERVRAFTAAGEIVAARIEELLVREADEFVTIQAERVVLRATPEHPFYVGHGEFRTVAGLKPGDTIYAFDGQGLSPQKILSLERQPGKVTVYNLHTDLPHTYFANGIAVHNKGGGCFPAGTPVRLAAGGEIAIEACRPGLRILAVAPDGQAVPATILALHAARTAVLHLRTTAGDLRTTIDHPLLAAAGGWREAGGFRPGESIMRWDGARLQPVRILGLASEPPEPVYTLSVEAPHSFLAADFAVHNKGGGFGGGFGGGGFHGGGFHSRSSSGDAEPWLFWVLLGIVVLIVVLSLRQPSEASDGDERVELDYLYARSRIEGKADKTLKLLEFISRTDREWDPTKLRDLTRSTFMRLQECWERRDYGPMEPLLMPFLYAQHCNQLAAMVGQHEINRIRGINIAALDLVNVRYPQDKDQREFTILITATAADYYVDDRTGNFLRGNREAAEFQEFWTFQRFGGRWALRDIEQTRESAVLTEENFFEPFTDTGVKQVYGATAAGVGAAGPDLSKVAVDKSTRIARLLNFLAVTDGPLWSRQHMQERARMVFMRVHLAYQKGDESAIPVDDLWPEAVQFVAAEIVKLQEKGTQVEFRNLCIRTAELILVRNFHDRSRDEFTVRIRAHAQMVMTRNGSVVHRDVDVTPFVACWVFGRRDEEWKLKENLPLTEAEKRLDAENYDEDSSPQMLQWYYSQTRAN